MDEPVRKALKDLTQSVACQNCGCNPEIPTRYGNCGHIVCKSCMLKSWVCAICKEPVQASEVYEDTTLLTIIQECNSIAQALQIDDLWKLPIDRSSLISQPVKQRSKPKKRKSNPAPINKKQINKINEKGETLLHQACLKLDEEKVKMLLDAGANPNTKDNNRWTPLQEVVSYGYTKLCLLLLEAGASPNTSGYEGRTALHEATLNNRLDEAKLLLKFGASPYLVNQRGNTPKDYIRSPEMQEIFKNHITDLNESMDSIANTSITSHLSNSFTHSKGICVYAPKLNEENRKLLIQVAAKHKMKIASSFVPSVTHFVVEANGQYTTSYDIMLAIVSGCWILSSDWLSLAVVADDISDLNLICEIDQPPIRGVPKKARENKEMMNPGLFNGCKFFFAIQSKVKYFVGDTEFTKESLTKLVTAGEGTVLSREPDADSIENTEDLLPFHNLNNPSHPLYKCTYYIIYVPGRDEPRRMYNRHRIKSLPLIWLTESIEKFTLVDPTHLGL